MARSVERTRVSELATQRQGLSPQQRREWIAYGVCLLIGILQFGVPRIWLTAREFTDEVGDYAGYVCIYWLGFILLMPTAAQYLGGRWVRLMGVRKQLGIGIGFFVIAHGVFSHVIGTNAELKALNPEGIGSGFLNFFFAVVLLLTSIDRVRLSMSRKWWECHQRVGTFGMLILGTTASLGSDRGAIAVVSQIFCAAVCVIRVAQLVHNRARVRRDHFIANLWCFLLVFGYMALCSYSGRFVVVTPLYLVLLIVIYAGHLIRRGRRTRRRQG